MVRVSPPFKELVSGPRFQLSFLKLSLVQTPFCQEQTFCWSPGELQTWVSSWKLFGFNPFETIPWSCTLLSTLQSSVPPCWLSQPFLWTSPSKVYYVLVPLNMICFVPAKGIIPSNLRSSLSLCVRSSTFPLFCIMSSASPVWLVYVLLIRLTDLCQTS